MLRKGLHACFSLSPSVVSVAFAFLPFYFSKEIRVFGQQSRQVFFSTKNHWTPLARRCCVCALALQSPEAQETLRAFVVVL